MKITRHKKVQKYLKFYYNNYGFRQPYQVLIDGTFCFAAFKEKINIKEQLPKYLSGHVKLLTTRCIIIETEKIGKKTHGALTILKQYGIHECGHNDPISGSECISSMMDEGNKKHYILATQDRALQDKFRVVAGVPLLYLHNKSPTLEKPSRVTYEQVNGKNDVNHIFITATQNEALKKMKHMLGIDEAPLSVQLRKKKQNNPNPLSCKKKKKNLSQDHKQTAVSSEGKIKKRNRTKFKKNKNKINSNKNNLATLQ